jgi:ABC-type multidrug transport system ATPase subunit
MMFRRPAPSSGGTAAIAEVRDVGRVFAGTAALRGISLDIAAGEIHALLGPNGAGKTTLLRLLSGLLDPTSGIVSVLGRDPSRASNAFRGRIGLVPSGDRTFYLRLSGLENLVFFARLHGMRRRAAIARAREVLTDVDLSEAGDRAVGTYSHGMQKRLSLARALLTDPSLLLVDEATHDLDPDAARCARELVSAVAASGAAVLWTTQRVEEIRGFADRVTLLSGGLVQFTGSVPELIGHAAPRRYLVRLRNGGTTGQRLQREIDSALEGLGMIVPAANSGEEHYLMSLRERTVLGQAIGALSEANVQVLSCSEEQPEIESAFLSLTRERRR